jgi:Xaa-Pro aminopeptidase
MRTLPSTLLALRAFAPSRLRDCPLVLVLGLLCALTALTSAQRLGFPAEEFTARRQALSKALGSGTVLLAGRTLALNGIRFRQDNDFFYLTGNEDLNAVLVLDAPSGDSWLFLPPQNASEIRSDGKNWLTLGDQATPRGFTAIQPITELSEFLARRRAGGAGRPVYTRLSERDEVDDSRGEQAVGLARRMSNPLGARPSDDAWRVEMLRQHFPAVELKDVTPAIDQLRVIKSPREIEILKLNGRLSAEAIRKAIEITRPGRFEYELEAEATYHLFRNGVQGNGYPAIVGTGSNVNVWHYQDNGRQMKAGDLVVMDYGGSLDYQVVDITRTWPVSGRFDELQLRAYQCALETQKAIIAAMRPGATRAETREISKRIYEKWGFADQRPAQAGHFVGMSVHDVGDYAAPFRPGMVIAVEPIIEIADKQLHIRIEDTVLITDGEPLILSAAVPKEVEEVLALMKQAGTK